MNVADKTVLITGSTDGVGKIVALRLAASGARALLHGRNEEKGENVLRAIRDETGNERLEYYQADFSSLDDVRRMAEAITSRHDRLELLINNARQLRDKRMAGKPKIWEPALRMRGKTKSLTLALGACQSRRSRSWAIG